MRFLSMSLLLLLWKLALMPPSESSTTFVWWRKELLVMVEEWGKRLKVRSCHYLCFLLELINQ